MSGWDARTGKWDSGEELEGSGSGDQGYQQTQPTGGHHAARGEGILRSGRQSLPGYDQAQTYDQPSGYDQPGGYDQPTAVYGAGTGAKAGYGSGTLPAQVMRYGRGAADEQPYGTSSQNQTYSIDPQDPLGSGSQDVLGSPPQTTPPLEGPSVPRRAIGSGSLGGGDYDRGGTSAYPAYGSQDAGSAAWSGVDDQGYGTQAFGQQDSGAAGYGQQPGTGQDFGTQTFGRPGYGQQDYGQGAPGYQTEAYSQGSESSGYTQGGYPDQGYGQSGYGQNGYGQASAAGTGYQQDGYGQDAYRQDAYGQGGYGQDAYGQPGLERPAGQPYGDENAPGLQPRAGQSRSGPRSPQRRLSGVRMVLYLLASVLGVVLIVLLVVHLTNSGSSNTPGATTSPTTGRTGGAVAGAGSGFVFTKAAKAGTFPLNATATRQYAVVAQQQAAPLAQGIKARGAGQPGKQTVAAYDLSPVTSVSSPDFSAVGFVGYDGTFNPAAVIRYMKSHLKSTRTVNPGAHGGKMMCGYNTATGTKASECVWVTPTTFGLVEFIKGQALVKYPGASQIALEVRNAVEVRAG